MFIWNWISFLVGSVYHFFEFLASRIVIGITWAFVQLLQFLFSVYAASSTPAKIVWIVVIGLLILMAIATLFKIGGQLAFVVVVLLPVVIFFTKVIVFGLLVIASILTFFYIVFRLKTIVAGMRNKDRRAV